VPVQPLAGRGGEDGSFAALADGQDDRAGGARGQGDDSFLAALAGDGQGAVAAFGAEGFDVRAGGFGDPQPVEGEQGDQRVFGRGAEPGSDQERADFVAVQAGGVGLVVDPRAADVGGRRVVEEVFLDRVPVEPGDGRQPAGHRRPGASGGFQVAGE
jgi:hypothetical protein